MILITGDTINSRIIIYLNFTKQSLDYLSHVFFFIILIVKKRKKVINDKGTNKKIMKIVRVYFSFLSPSHLIDVPLIENRQI